MIYFDVTRLVEWQGRYTGMEVVAYEFAAAFLERGARLIYFVPGKGFVDISESVILGERTIDYPYVRRGALKLMIKREPSKIVNELRRRYFLNHQNSVEFTRDDIFFTSDGLWDRQDYIQAVLDISKERARIIHLVHDIVPVVVPHLVHGYMTEAMTGYFQQVAPAIDTLISISENTQKDFLAAFGSSMKPGISTQVFHHGDDVPQVEPQRPERLKAVQNFLLCVGTIEIRKNHMLLYQVYKLAKEQKVDLPPLVIIGRDGWLSDQALKLMRDDPEIKDKIIFLGPAPDSELVWCYKNCLFTIMPSFYEGWGLPVAQSLFYGKVAAASHTGPLTEVGGDLNVYFSPFSTEDCLEAMNRLIDESERQTREERIKNEYRATTWHSAVSSVIDSL